MTDVKRVIIDAGHGGEEPGAMYDGRREKRRYPAAGSCHRTDIGK